MATLGSVYSVDANVRTPEEVVEALFRQPGQILQSRYREAPTDSSATQTRASLP